MKRFTKTVATVIMSMAIFASCQQNLTEDLAESEALNEAASGTDLSSEEIISAADNISISYSITAIADDNSEIEITNDASLKEYGNKNKKPRIKFPIEIVVDGETVTVNTKEELKALIGESKKGHRPPPFELVFPVTVTTATGDLVIADKEAFKAHIDSLEKGTRPAFVFPISIIINDETTVVNSEEELKAILDANKPDNDRPERPEFVFPISVVTATGNLEIADEAAMKAYVDTLEKGTHPTFVFPISLIIDDETVIVNNEEELKALMPKKGGERPERPEFVFPISVVTATGNLDIADEAAMKAYMDTLEKGTHPTFVFPISLIIDNETVVVNNEEELKALMPKKGGKRPERPEFVFPISVVTATGNLDIADKEAMKSYVDTLEKGTHPTFVFPISLIIDDETVVANNEDELKALMPKKGRKK